MTAAGSRVERKWPAIPTLLSLADRLAVPINELARVGGLSNAMLRSISTYGQWPRLRDRAVVGAALRELLLQRGADPLDVDLAFDEQAQQRRRAELWPAADSTPRTGHPKSGRRARANTSEVDVLIAKQVLDPAAGRHFKLFSNPFDGPVQRANQFFVSDEIAFVREMVWQCAHGGGFLALIGESGSGKTTILEDLDDRLARESGRVVLIKPATLGMEETSSQGHATKSADLLWAVISTLDGSARMPVSLQGRTELATRMLIASARVGNAHVLAVEEAHSMPEATLRHLKRLHELRLGRRSLLSILLLGQPELKRRMTDGLRSGDLREVAQRCELVEIAPLGPALKGYLECRARAAGRELQTLVDAAAIEALGDKLTARVGPDRVPMSYPLAVNNMVTRALNRAAKVGAPLVTEEVVRAI